MKFQIANTDVLSSTGVAHVTIQMYGYKFNLPIFVCDLGVIDCIYGLDVEKEAGFITCARTGIIWFNTNKHDEPKQLSRSNCNAICHLLAVHRIELKPFKDTIIEVAYVKSAMSKRCQFYFFIRFWLPQKVLGTSLYLENPFIICTTTG